MAITGTLYGYPLLLLPPDLDKEASPDTHSVDLDVFVVDTGASRQTSRPAVPNFKRQIGFLFETRDAWSEMEDFLDTLAGKAYPFWLPTWNDDLIVLAASFFQIDVQYLGFTANLQPHPEFQKGHIIYEKANPSNWWHRPTGTSVDNGDGTESLFGAIDFPYPGTFVNATTALGFRFMFYSLVRLDTDDVEIEYLSGETVQVTLPVFHVPEG